MPLCLEDVDFFFLPVTGFFGWFLLMPELKYKHSRGVVSTALNDRGSVGSFRACSTTVIPLGRFVEKY